MACGLVGTAAGVVVQDGWAQWKHKAEQFRSDAQAFLSELLDNPDFDLKPVPVAIDFGLVESALGGAFRKPEAPARPDLAFASFTPPGEPGLLAVDPPSFPAVPALATTAPALSLPSAPAPLALAAPGAAPALEAIPLPAVPELALPAVPALRALALPTAPAVHLPSWSAQAPSAAELAAPAGTFRFTETPYASEVLEAVRARVLSLLAGGTGLPEPVWTALWERARGREEEASLRLIQEASEEWAARGFVLPPGALVAQVAAARQAVQSAASTLSRELFIQAAQMEQTSLQFAVAQGIALESLLIGQHGAEMQRALEAARYTLEAALQVFQARVALYQAELQGYQTEAQIYRSRIEAELAALEIYKTELEGQRLIGELNRQDVEIYRARIEAVQAAADLYRTQVAGVEVAVRANGALIDAYKAGVEAYGERVRAQATEAQIYAETVRGELAKAQIFEIETHAFAKRIDAWRTETQALGEQKKIALEMNESKIRLFAARVDAYRSQIQAEAERIRAGASVYDAEARMFASELGAESARVEAEGRQFQLALEKARAEADLAIKQADLNIQQVQRLLALELERIKTVNNVHAQLAAATMAAVNLSASISEGASNSASCTYDAT